MHFIAETEYLDSGVHSFGFEFDLPRKVGLPSTFQGNLIVCEFA